MYTRESETECEDWSDEDGGQTAMPEAITRELLLQAESVQIDSVNGQPVMGFRILRYLGEFSEWETVRRPEDVREIRAENLWLFEGEKLAQGRLTPPNLTDDDPIPALCELEFGPDPDTGEPYKRYGAWVMASGEIAIHWYADQGQAQKLHQVCVEHLEAERRRRRAYEEEAEKRRPWNEACSRCDELLNDKVLNRFGHHLDRPAGIARAVLREENRHCHLWTSAADFLAGGQAIDVASRELAVALEALKESRLAIIREYGLVARLNDLLERNIPLCPLCFEPYQRDAAWLEQLLMEGEAFLGFEGRASVSWGADEEDLPSRIADFFRVRKYAPQFLTVLDPDDPDDPYEGRHILLRHLEIDGVTIANFVGLLDSGNGSPVLKSRQQLLDEGFTAENVDRYLADHLPNEYVSPVVLVDLVALAQASPKDRGKLVDDWADTMRQFNELQQAEAAKRQAEAEEEVRTGKAVKLSFRWDERRGRWSTWLKDGEHKTVWVLDTEVVEAINPHPNAVYFCHIIRTPPRTQTPTLTFHIVRPFLQATSRLRHMRSDFTY